MEIHQILPHLCQRAIITGGSAGIGLETAKKFYINGFDVMLCARNKENLDRAKHDIEQLSSKGESKGSNHTSRFLESK